MPTTHSNLTRRGLWHNGSSASTTYGSNSTSFANTETVGLDCDLDSGEVAEAESEAGPSTKIVSYYVYMCIQ